MDEISNFLDGKDEIYKMLTQLFQKALGKTFQNVTVDLPPNTNITMKATEVAGIEISGTKIIITKNNKSKLVVSNHEAAFVKVTVLSNPDGLYALMNAYIHNAMGPTVMNKFKIIQEQYGILPHEQALFLLLNDARYPFEFLNKLLLDLPETHNPIHTLDRYRESMKWITRTLKMVRTGCWPNDSMPDVLQKQLINLEQMTHLVCAEQAKRNGYELDFDFESAESIKTMDSKAFYIPPFYIPSYYIKH